MINIYRIIRDANGYVEKEEIVKKVIPQFIEMVDYDTPFETEFNLGYAMVKLKGDDYLGYYIKKEDADKL